MTVVILLVIIVAIFLITNWFFKRTIYEKTLNAIPGPSAFPLIGNLIDIMFCDEEKLFKLIRKFNLQFGTIFRFWLGPLPSIHMSSPHDIELVVSSTKHNKKSELYDVMHMWLGTGLLTSDGSKWHKRRKILTPTFHFNILQEFLIIFTEQTELLVKQLEKECSKPCTNVIPLITNFTLNSICETAMGTYLDPNDKNQEEYRRCIYDMGELVVYRNLRPWLFFDIGYMFSPKYWKQKKVVKVLHDFSRNVIYKRQEFLKLKKEHQETDNNYSSKKRLAMLDLLLTAKAEGAGIDDEGIREEVDTFMFEGHDTTSVSLCFTLMLLACNKEAQDKIATELEEVFGNSDRLPTYTDLQQLHYLELCIKESLRLYPSVPLISRITDEEIKTRSGYILPQNTTVVVHIYDIHRDPKIYPEPEKFIPERFLSDAASERHPYAYLPFSAGPRNCIGQKFAMLELKTVLSGILRKYILDPVDKPNDIRLIVDMVLRTKDNIRVKFRPRTKQTS